MTTIFSKTHNHTNPTVYSPFLKRKKENSNGQPNNNSGKECVAAFGGALAAVPMEIWANALLKKTPQESLWGTIKRAGKDVKPKALISSIYWSGAMVARPVAKEVFPYASNIEQSIAAAMIHFILMGGQQANDARAWSQTSGVPFNELKGKIGLFPISHSSPTALSRQIVLIATAGSLKTPIKSLYSDFLSCSKNTSDTLAAATAAGIGGVFSAHLHAANTIQVTQGKSVIDAVLAARPSRMACAARFSHQAFMFGAADWLYTRFSTSTYL